MLPLAVTTAETSPGPRWTRLEHADRREQILSCARRLFSERHYGAVSMGEVAEAAGVTRGLLHHYFGSKRDLYLEVVRSMLTLPAFFAEGSDGGDPEAALTEAVDRWLRVVSRNRETFLAVAGTQEFGRDPEMEAIAEDARERSADQVIRILRSGDPEKASPELRALVRAYAGFVLAATLDWLDRRQLTREQLQEMLVQGLLQLHREVLPRLEALGTTKETR
jgi:AcrR family transcriptional regulator